MIATGDWVGHVVIWDVSSGRPAATLEAPVFLPDGERLLAVGGANDGFLIVLSLNTKSVALQDKAPAHVHDVALGDKPDLIFSGGHGRITVYEGSSGIPGW
jgi:hypothetical protein